MDDLYNQIGQGYDVTRRADDVLCERLFHHLQLEEGSKVLDVACGTGNYTVALETKGLMMTGTDVSEEMLKLAKAKNERLQWIEANVLNLPFQGGVFNGVTCSLAIHHFTDLLSAFCEVFRVMKSGRFVIFTSSPEQMSHYWLNAYFPEAMKASMEQMPAYEVVKKALQESGFTIIGSESYLVQPSLQDFFLYSGKYKPEMYLDRAVRKGISTFANLASREEVERGLSKLESDLTSGAFQDVFQSYSSDLGDYMFVIGEKVG